MSNTELRGNKKRVITELLDNGDMSVYGIRDMKLTNPITKKTITKTGINRMVQKLFEMGAIDIVPSDRGDVVSAKRENIICKRSTESMKPDAVFLLVLTAIYTVFYFVFFTEIFFIIGSLSSIVFVAIYLFGKVMGTPEMKSVFVKVGNGPETKVRNNLNQGS